MANKTLDWAERRRVELDRDRGSQAGSPLIAADSIAEVASTDVPEIEPEPFAPGNRRFSFRTRSYD